ncbi:PRELI domain-containing protein 1, mitochondrial-like [Artemia franciscana]|uniref:PRELI/MSF1 domain-containing protein n=1 Tax=Artemia franciscana TaxID=6661 RepID=A0AA88IE66_ARTSF|nr:hypothetical protein QYM36_007471 [Artemia franciscana]
MVKHYESNSVFHYPWEYVATAFWWRYPNPYSKHVLSEDVLWREQSGNILLTKRIFTKTNSLPKWGERFIPAKLVHILEESLVDREKKVLTTLTKNIGFSKVMSVVEKVTYRPCAENPDCTNVSREAWIESEMFGFRKAIEAFGYERFKLNSKKASAGFKIVLAAAFPQLASQQNGIPKPPSSERLKEAARETAKRASDIAKETASPLFAACNFEKMEKLVMDDDA